MDATTLARHYRHLLRDILGEVDIDLGQTFDEIADFMLERAQELSPITDDLKFDFELRFARNEVALFAGLRDTDLEDRHLIGAIQGALAIGARMVSQQQQRNTMAEENENGGEENRLEPRPGEPKPPKPMPNPGNTGAAKDNFIHEVFAAVDKLRKATGGGGGSERPPGGEKPGERPPEPRPPGTEKPGGTRPEPHPTEPRPGSPSEPRPEPRPGTERPRG